MVILFLVLIVFCCLVIWKASDSFETASEYLGKNLSEGVRGATINAIGSSIPELFTTVFFLLILKNQEGFSGGIGTTAGSAIFNAMVIPAFVILTVILIGKIKFIQVSRKVILRDGLALLICEFILIYLLSSGTLYWWHGSILMMLYIIYITFMFISMKKNKSNNVTDEENDDPQEEEELVEKGFLYNLVSLNLEKLVVGHREINKRRAWALLIWSTIIIGFATALLVKSCEEIGYALNTPIYFVAVILASAATSVPDTVLSIKDAQKGNYDDAVSNALGSNIFDICFALGLPLFLYTLFFNPIQLSGDILENVNELRILLFIITLTAFIIYFVSKKLTITQGALLIIIYVLFVVFIFGKSLQSGLIKPVEVFLNNILRLLL